MRERVRDLELYSGGPRSLGLVVTAASKHRGSSLKFSNIPLHVLIISSLRSLHYLPSRYIYSSSLLGPCATTSFRCVYKYTSFPFHHLAAISNTLHIKSLLLQVFDDVWQKC